MIRSVFTKKAPKVVGPYSQAIKSGDFIFCSGQIGVNPETGKLVEGIENQVHQIMRNLTEVLVATKSDLNHVVKTTIYLADMNHYVLVNQIYGDYFKKSKPARATVQVSRLPIGALVEIEAIAVKK